MEGFLWLLLQILPLLTAAAMVFFILGWRWRGQDSRKENQARFEKTDTENVVAESARQERDTARASEEKVRLLLIQSQTEQQEAQDRQTQLQKEILRLSDELKLARQSPPSPVVEIPDLSAEKAALETEKQSLSAEKESLQKLREELEAARSALTAPALVPVPTKPRATKSAGKPKKPRAVGKKSEG